MFRVRLPSVKRKIAARTSVARATRNATGLRATRGLGWISSPRRAFRNRVYNRTTMAIGTAAHGCTKAPGCAFAVLIVAWLAWRWLPAIVFPRTLIIVVVPIVIVGGVVLAYRAITGRWS
jgi:hypothetical protein